MHEYRPFQGCPLRPVMKRVFGQPKQHTKKQTKILEDANFCGQKKDPLRKKNREKRLKQVAH